MHQVIERHFGIEEVKGQALKVISEVVINKVSASVHGSAAVLRASVYGSARIGNGINSARIGNNSAPIGNDGIARIGNTDCARLVGLVAKPMLSVFFLLPFFSRVLTWYSCDRRRRDRRRSTSSTSRPSAARSLSRTWRSSRGSSPPARPCCSRLR